MISQTVAQPLHQYYAKLFVRYAGFGFLLSALAALGISFILARNQMSSDLQESAMATIQAFHDRIIDGDIRSVEPQINQILKIQSGESAQILNADLSRTYPSFANFRKVETCPTMGETCSNNLFGDIRILAPISFSLAGPNGLPFRYLYVYRKIHINWIYFTTIFILFLTIYVLLFGVFLRFSKLTSKKLSLEISNWSDQLHARPPLAELMPLKEVMDISRQVAHDIRSPLSALNMVASTFTSAEENKRALIRNAVQRINDIANDLLRKGASAKIKNPGDSGIISLPSLLDAILSEKRIQFQDQAGVHIESDFKHGLGASVRADGKEISRVISNLINNSVESFQDKRGHILVQLHADARDVRIIIKDNGQGIPKNILARLGEQGLTHGKENTASGSGLGIYHAKQTIERLGGRFIVESELGVGTSISIQLPRIQ